MFEIARHRLLKTEQRYLLSFARETIKARLLDLPPPDFPDKSFPYDQKRGAFVTLTRQGKLRGCIGLVYGIKPLYQAVADAAESAAFNDPRFPPLTYDELPEISIEISVISPLKRVKQIKQIKVPKHGVLLRYGSSSGILLPQVAAKNNWDRVTLLEHACAKAGLDKGCWRDKGVDIMVFEAQVFSEDDFPASED